MQERIRNNTAEKVRYPAGLLNLTEYAVWISIALILLISLLALCGWIFGIAWLKSMGESRVPMSIIGALCYAFTSIALAISFAKRPSAIKVIAPALTGIFLIVVSILSIFSWLYGMRTGHESSLTLMPVFNLFLPTPLRMPLYSASLFLFTGIIMCLFAKDDPVLSNIAHLLFILPAIAGYMIPVSYLLNFISVHRFFDTPVAINSGIAFCAIIIAVYFMRPESVVMRVFTSKYSGGVMARRLFPWIIILPLSIGWFRIYGEHAGWFISESGVLLVAITYTFCFILLVWIAARSVNTIDVSRRYADEALKKSYDELEIRVIERTEELMKLNKILDIEIGERIKAEANLVSLNAELEQRVNKRTEELLMANNSLRTSEERYRSLMELSPGASFVSRNNSIVLVNTAARKLLGVSSAEELKGRSTMEIFHHGCQDPFRAGIEEIMNGVNVPMAEYQIVRADGTLLDVEVVASGIVDSEGPALQVIMSDITERKRAEKELHDTKNYLENLINNANAPIIVWDKENRIRLFNHAFENLTGYTSSEVEGKKLDLLFPVEFLIESMTKIGQALTHDWKTIEIPVLTKKGEIRIVLWNSAKIYNKITRSFSTIAQGNDITERIEAENAFKESREKLEIALENGKIGIWEWDILNDVFQWDKRMERMFGRSRDTFEGTFSSFEKSIHEEDLPHFRNAFRQASTGNVPLDTIFRIRHKDDSINYISTKALIERDKNNNPVKFSGVCFDITEMKKGAEKAMFQLNEDLLRSNKELEQFAYVASHDLQEPLRMVSSFTQLLSQRYKDKLDQNAQEFIRFAVDGAARMQILINDLLEFSRIETKGKRFSGVDIHQVLGQVVNNLKLNIGEKGALVTNDELPVVFADERQMVQLFQNLIGNALKFCKDSPRIHISSREEAEFYLISVSDNGIGIENQYFNRIFQIFQRLHAKDEYGGTGIGLAICKRIIERHGGKIWVESKPDIGSVFYFTIIKR